MKKLVLTVVAALAGAAMVWAETLVMNGADVYDVDFCTDASRWSPAKVPGPEDVCSNGSGGILNTPNTNEGEHVFNGKSLTINGNCLGWYTEAPATLEFANDGLFLNGGSNIRTRKTGASRGIVKGKLTLNDSTMTTAAEIKSTVPTAADLSVEGCLQVEASFHGAAGTQLKVTRYNASYYGPTAVEFMGDASDFFGTVIADIYNDRVRTGCANFAGTIQLSSGGTYETCAAVNGETGVATIRTTAAGSAVIVRAANTLRVANLELAGGTVTVRHDQQNGAGCLVVTDAISASTKATFVADVGLDADNMPHKYDVLKVKKTIGTIDQFFTWDTTGKTTYTTSEDGDYYVLSAQNPNLNIVVAGGVTKTLQDIAIGGGRIEVGFDATTRQTGCAEFTGNFALTDGGKIVVKVAEISSGSTGGNIANPQPRCAVLKAPADKLNPADVTIDWSAKAYAELSVTGYLPGCYSEVVTEGDQVVFYVGYRPVVKRGRWEGAETENDKKVGPIEDGNYWSDGLAPHADADYLLPYQSSGSGGPFQMTFTGMTFEDNKYTFPGNSLTMGFYVNLPTGLAEFKVDGDLTLLLSRNKSATSGFYFSDGQRDASGMFVQKVTATRLRVFPINLASYYDFYNTWPGFGIASSRIGEINAPLEGTESSGVKFFNSSSSNATQTDYDSNFRLTQRSPDFLGCMVVCYNWGTYYPKATRPIRLRIADPLALGGAPGSFLYNALILTDWARLVPTESMTLATANRGVFVRGHGGFEVPGGVKLALNERLTLSGEMLKLGAGTLVLGSETAPQFATEEKPDPVGKITVVEAPSEGLNVVTVSEGALAATTQTALQGLAVTFAGGAIAVDPSAAEGSFAKTYGGLYSNDDAGSVAVADGKKVGVEFDVSRKTFGDELAATICTVKTGSLTTESFTLVPPWGRRGYGMTVEAVDNGDGTTTFTATAGRAGAMVFLR